MKKDILTDAEVQAVKGIISPQFLADYNLLDAFYKTVDTRTEQEKAVGRTAKPGAQIKKVTPSMEAFNDFKADMEKEIERIMGDDLYDARQKQVLINQIAREKADHYKSQITEKMAEYTEKATTIKDYLAQVVNATEQMTPVQMREHEFVGKEMNAETRTALMTAFTPSQVLAIFNKQIDMAKHNQAKARFLHKNAYLHMERVQGMEADIREKARITTEIQKSLNHLERYAYSPGQTGLKKMVNNARTFNRTGTEGIRAIDNWMGVYTR